MSGPVPHGEPGHVHDPSCAMAHGELPAPTDGRELVVVFASPVARELADLAGRLGWSVSLLEPDAERGAAEGLDVPRAASADEAELGPAADVVVCDHERPELGEVLAAVLARPTRWVGVMGSPRHSAPHVEALRRLGVDEVDVARVHRPIGLDIGSKSPPEIAVSTVAGLLAHRTGRPGGPFRPA